jgi:hypothetical protein
MTAWRGSAALCYSGYESRGRDEELRVEKLHFSLTSPHGDEGNGGQHMVAAENSSVVRTVGGVRRSYGGGDQARSEWRPGAHFGAGARSRWPRAGWPRPSRSR